MTNDNSSVYYHGHYWNDYEFVREQLNYRVSQNINKSWYDHFFSQKGEFKKALILNCGNGWVERDMVSLGIIREGIGIDCSSTLLELARKDAEGLPLRYYEMDVNCGDFPEGGYDLVVNFAAAHHITHIDRVFRKIAELLPETGCFVHYDYIGPHRNQYPRTQWRSAWKFNKTLPAHLQQKLKYPHLPTMLLMDPTEAVHSELVVPILNRYFYVEEQKLLGGAIAYLLLTFNENMQFANKEEQEKWGRYIMDYDYAYLNQHPESSLFSFIISYPKKNILDNEGQLKVWAEEENKRENHAKKRGGIYYPISFMERVYLKLQRVFPSRILYRTYDWIKQWTFHS